jgi:GFO/IDH/MocA oxidoreductase family protein
MSSAGSTSRATSTGGRDSLGLPPDPREPMRVSASARRGAVAPVRFGLVGYGFGARYFHAPLIASATECELVAVATRSAERRALVATEHPHPAVVNDLAGLLAAGAEAVTVSTPADTHIPLCREAVDARNLGRAVELPTHRRRCPE